MTLLASLLFIVSILFSFRAGYRKGRYIDTCVGLALGTACAALPVVATVQILSLFYALTPITLAAGTALVTLLMIFTLKKIKNNEPSFLTSVQELITTIRDSRILTTVFALQLILILALLIIGLTMFPHGDNYHFSRPYYWLQNRSILPFPVFNERITAFAPGADILLLPAVAYARFGAFNVVLSTLCIITVPFLVWSLSRRLDFSKEASIFAALSSLGITLFGGAIAGGKHDVALPMVLIGGSFIALLDSRERWLKGDSWIQSAGISMFLFAFAAGLKDPMLLLVPAFLLTFIVLLGKGLVKSRRALIVVACLGLTGALLSGGVWRLAVNQIYFGDSRGPDLVVRSSLAPSMSPSEVWTRVVRGTTFLGDISIPLPSPLNNIPKKGQQLFLTATGAKPLLTGENPGVFNSFDPTILPMRKGFGPLGIFILISILLSFLPDKSAKPESLLRRRLLSLFFIVSFVLLHATVRWSVIGRLRFAHALALVGCALLPLILRRTLIRTIVIAVAMLNIIIVITTNSSIALTKAGAPLARTFSKFERLLNRHSSVAIKHYADGRTTDFIVRLNYTQEEILKDIANVMITSPSTIGLISNFNSEDLFLFGEKGQHKVVPLVESDPNFGTNLASVDYIVDNINEITNSPVSSSFDLTLFYEFTNIDNSVVVYQRNPSSKN